MTQLALLLVLGLLGSLLAFVLGRAEIRRAAVSATVKRAEGAIERASLLLLRDGALRGGLLLVVPASGLVAFLLLSSATASVSNGGRALFALVALLLGAGSALLQARLAIAFGVRAASSAAAARARGSASSMRPLLRAAVAIAVFGEGLGLFGVAALFASLYAIRGGFAATTPNAASAAETDADADDSQDPALLARLVAQLVGELLPTTLAGYVGGLVATASVALFAASAPTVSLSALLLVILVRAFGAIAAVCGALAARVTEDEAPALALLRSQLAALPVALFGVGAALFWLMREHWLPAFAAGAAGACSTTLVALVAAYVGTRGSGRDDSRGFGDAATIVRALAAAWAGVWPSLLVPLLAFIAVERGLGPHAPLSSLLVAFIAGALALAPLASSTRSFGLLAAQARDVVVLARLDMVPANGGRRLDQASLLSRAAGGTQASLALAASLLLGFVALVSPASASTGVGLGALSIGLGLSLVALFCFGTVRDAVSGARLIAVEMERLRPDVAPSYKACVDAAQRASRAGSLLELGLLLGTPFLLGAWLHFTGVAGGGVALATFSVAAVAAGLILTLVGRATRSRLSEARARSREGSPAASVSSDFGDLVGFTLATSIEALAFVLALTVFCLAPLLR